MIPNDDTSQTEKIALTYELRHSPDKVWRALTNPLLLAEWLLPVFDFAPAKGRAFRFQAPPQPGWDGTVNCQILEIDPGHMISYSWVVGALDTVVSFTITPTEYGTQLDLVHSGFQPDQKQNLAGARYGWTLMTGRLIDLLARPCNTSRTDISE